MPAACGICVAYTTVPCTLSNHDRASIHPSNQSIEASTYQRRGDGVEVKVLAAVVHGHLTALAEIEVVL